MITFDPTLLHDWLTHSTRRHPGKEAIVCEQTRWTYAQLDNISTTIAHTLIRRGLSRHDRVVVFADNTAEVVAALYGIMKAGGVFAIINGGTKTLKLRYVLKNCTARIIMTSPDKVPVVEEAVAGLMNPCEVIAFDEDGLFTDEPPSASVPALPRCIETDLAALIYTSGSTGEPKGVMSTHANMISAARSIIQYLGNEPDDIILNSLPLSFDYGLYQVIMSVMFGGTLVLEKSFNFPHLFMERIAAENVTGLPVVPTIAAMLLRMKDLSRYDTRTLRYITSTGAALPPAHILRLSKLLPHARLFSMFGLTECKRVCYLPPEELSQRPASVGKPMPNCEVSVVDENGREVAPREIGQLVVRGANVMQGYWNDPELTARTYRPGRYPSERLLHTGDFFTRDEEGFLYFLGRADDMIKTKGERVSAKEIANALCALDGVSEATATGVADATLGQAIHVFVVPEAATDLTERQILKYCSETLEPYMMPQCVHIVDALPKSANGKIQRQALQPAGS